MRVRGGRTADVDVRIQIFYHGGGQIGAGHQERLLHQLPSEEKIQREKWTAVTVCNSNITHTRAHMHHTHMHTHTHIRTDNRPTTTTETGVLHNLFAYCFIVGTHRR